MEKFYVAPEVEGFAISGPGLGGDDTDMGGGND